MLTRCNTYFEDINMIYAKSKFLWFFITIVFGTSVILDAFPVEGETSTKVETKKINIQIPDHLVERNYELIIYQYSFLIGYKINYLLSYYFNIHHKIRFT